MKIPSPLKEFVAFILHGSNNNSPWDICHVRDGQSVTDVTDHPRACDVINGTWSAANREQQEDWSKRDMRQQMGHFGDTADISIFQKKDAMGLRWRSTLRSSWPWTPTVVNAAWDCGFLKVRWLRESHAAGIPNCSSNALLIHREIGEHYYRWRRRKSLVK